MMKGIRFTPLQKGFTLMETMMVLIIVIILAGAAVFYGGRPLEFARARAARATLEVIYAAQNEYCIHHGSYAIDLATLVNGAYLDDPNDPDQTDWIYSITGGGGGFPNDCGGFVADAMRTAGPNAGESLLIDETGVIDDSFWIP